MESVPGHLSELHPVNEVNTKGQFFRASFGKKPQVPKMYRFMFPTSVCFFFPLILCLIYILKCGIKMY